MNTAPKDQNPDDWGIPECKSIVDPFAPLQDLNKLTLGTVSFNKGRDELNALRPNGPAIDAGLKVVVADPPPEFRFHQVEQLLSQAATLLERAISSRAEWQALGEKSIAIALELKEFCDLEAVHNEETKEGYYALQPILSYNSDEAEKSNVTAAWNATKPYWDRFIKPPNAEPQVKETLPESIVRGQACYLKEQEGVAEAKRVAALAQSRYDYWNIDFRRRRTEVARRQNALKLAAYREPGGAYNFEERRSEIQQRFVLDFNEAMERLAVIKDGFRKVYGYKWELSDPATPLNQSLIAVRTAMEWLARFSALEQNYILAISLRAVLGEQWVKRLSLDEHAGMWEFSITRDYFPNQAHVRLRGVGLTVDTKTADCGLYQAVFRVPETATTVFRDGTVNPILQKIPVTRVARIQHIDSPREPDMVGSLSLHNVSPLGTWRLGVTSSPMPLGIDDVVSGMPTPASYHKGSELTDVVLHLLVAVRAL